MRNANGSTPQRSDGTRLSIGLTIGLVFALVAGAALGLVEYRAHAGETVSHDPSGNAVGVFGVLGLLLVSAVGIYWWRKGARPDFLAPIRRRSAARLRVAVSATARNLLGALRAVAAVLLCLLMLYLVFRMGMQVTAGFAPAFVTNAWGGPTAIGAFLAHGLGALVVGIFCLAMLDRVILPSPDRAAGHSRSSSNSGTSTPSRRVPKSPTGAKTTGA